MTKFHFVGPQTNLGRFGTVRRGDVLDLTNKEEADIKGDKRFRPYDPKAKFVVTDLPLPEGFDDLPADQQKKLLAEIEQAEITRKADLEKANLATAGVELDELSRDELLEMATELRKKGVNPVFQKDANRRTIKKAIELVLNISHREEDTGADEDDDKGKTEGTGETGAAGTIKTPVVPPVPAVPPGEGTKTEGTGAPEGDGKPQGKARELPAGLDEMPQPELDEVIAAMKAEGRVVEPKTGKRADKIAAIKEASAVLM